MAINKNFVIKNGIQVNDTLLVGDSVNNKVGINTSLPDYELEVIGGIGVTDVRIAGVTTALGDFLVANDSGEDGKAFSVRVSAGNSVGINTANPRFPLEVVGPLSIGYTAQYIFGDLDVSGDIFSANFSSGNAQFSGITTFTDTTANVLGDANTGSVQLDGGLGVEGNVTVGSGLSVFGNSFFVGIVTFAAGASGTIQLGDNADDSVEFQADVNSNIIPNTTSAFDLGSSSQEWRDLHLAGNAGIGSFSVSGISTFSLLTENRIPIVGAGNTIEDDANLTFDGNTLAIGAGVTIVGVSTFNNNVRIASLTENRIPIVGVGNTIEDDANLTFDATTLSVGAALTVTGITTFTNTTENTLGDTSTGAVKIAGGLGVAGNVTVGSGLSVFGNSYFVGMVTFAAGTDGNITIGDANTDNVVFNADVDSSFIPNTDNTYDLGSSSQQWKDLYVNGLAELDFVNVSAASTFGSDLDINADVDISGNAGIGSLVVTGISTFVGLSTFNDGLIVHTGITTLATLNIGNAIGITSIVDEDNMASDSATALPTQQSVKAYVDAQVTAQDLDFQADTGGALSIDLDSETLSVLGTTNEIETAGSGNQIQIGLPNNVIVGSALTVTDVFAVGTAITASSGIITATSLDISGNAGIGSLRVSGISTFVGLSTFNDGLIVHSGISTFESRIVGAARSNVIPFYYDNVSDFPSAVTYHGAFGHAHNTGKAYFAHGGVWLELVNANTASVVGTGTEGYNVGVITATQADIGTGGLDVDGHTELDGVNVSGVTTTQILHVGTAGTTLTVDAENATFAIGSATTTVTATMNGGAIPSIGLVIALGG